VSFLLVVLVVVVALAGATFFEHRLTALLVLLAVPVGILLDAAYGIGVTFILGLSTVFSLLALTISDTSRQLRAASRPRRARAPSTRGPAA
jgi:hypothetical protein